MKREYRFVGCLLATVLVMIRALDCFGIVGNTEAVKLPCVAPGVSPKTTETRPGVTVWDVSEFSMCRGRDLVASYGDSLYSETINRHRIDYKTVGDSIKICTIQSPMARIVFTDCEALPIRDYNSVTSHFIGTINYAGAQTGTVDGTILRNNDGVGLFIGFEGDTIRNVSRITDVFDIVLHFEVTEEAVRIERSRWFSPGTELPFAVSERVCSRDSIGGYVENSVTFSTITSDELRRFKDEEDKTPVNDEDILRILDSIEVSGTGDVLYINGMLVDNHVLNADIIDAAGNHFGIEKFETLPATMSLSGLLPGNYIVVLSVTKRPELTVKRMFVRH